MKNSLYLLFLGMAIGLFASCSQEVKVFSSVDTPSPLVEDYADMVVPPNIAPLNFFVDAKDGQEALVLTCNGKSISAISKDGAIIPALDAWKGWASKNEQVEVKHCRLEDGKWIAYRSFTFRFAEEEINPYLVYRLIPPGYTLWNEMGIYQRNLENFEETAILENVQTDRNCMNCHSFCVQDPEKMMFHLRAKHAGTILMKDGNIRKLETKTEQTMSALVYPYWHPSGNYIAFSVNDTKQLFHTNHPNRIEVMDLASDVVVYDVERNEIITTPLTFGEESFETFPSFSADGKTLYFCSARKQALPDSIEALKYHLCAISFDEKTGTFGNRVDTLFHAERMDRSVSFPRVSPDGRFLMVTLADHATFPIWHQEADLWMLDMQDGNKLVSLDALNSTSVESYHSWSSNGRWIVFSSRRTDGLHTRPYIAYIDANGTAGKPFVLPQERGNFYQECMNSFNIPELVKGKVETGRYTLIQKILDNEKEQVKMKKKINLTE